MNSNVDGFDLLVEDAGSAHLLHFLSLALSPCSLSPREEHVRVPDVWEDVV